MKITIHGATNHSNFGDILFADLFYKEYRSRGHNVDFLSFPLYGIGEFCRRTLNYHRKQHLFEFLASDCLILMSGGYFGEDKQSKHNTINRYLRYFLPARIFMLTGKPIYVLGIGGGPLFSNFLRKNAVKILDYANVVNVRDEESKKYFIEYGCKSDINVTTDTALLIDESMLPDLEDKKVEQYIGNSRSILLHLVFNQESDKLFSESVIPALNRFIEEHVDYRIVITTDGVVHEDIHSLLSFKALKNKEVYIYKYYDSWQLCSLINKVTLIITMKLHVGIVAAALGKSVISFPAHREKVGRFYAQIDELDRSTKLSEVDANIAYEKITKYSEKPVVIDNALKKKAFDNLIDIR